MRLDERGKKGGVARRERLHSRATTALLTVWAALTVAPAAAHDPPRIVAGPMFTSVGDEIIVWVQTDSGALVRFEAEPRTEGGDQPRVSISLRQVNLDQHIHTGKARLMAAVPYRCSILSSGHAPHTLLDDITITPPPPPGHPGRYAIAFGSCSHQERFPERQPIWEVVARQKPDCFFFIGDNIYLPNRAREYPPTRAEVLKLYCETYNRERRMPEMQPLLRSTMSFALWDDHDFGPNNSDRTWKWKDVALESMNLYFPNRYGLPDAPGCFYRFSWGDVDVFMLDDRTYRDPNNDPQRQTFLGKKQLAWLKDGLAESKASFKLIVCGNQALSDTHPHESWGVQFRPERDEFLEWLWERKTSGVIFLAGDRHFAELVCKKDPKKRGPDLWELTSSPLANEHYKAGPSFANPDRIAAYSDGVNVGVLKFDTTADPPRVELNVLDVRGNPVIRHQVVAAPRAEK